MSSRDNRPRDRERRHRDAVRREFGDPHSRSPDNYSSSDEYEDFNRVQARRSAQLEQRPRRSETRRDRSRSPDRVRPHDSHSAEGRDRHRRHASYNDRDHAADEELEEGQYLPEEEDDDNVYENFEKREETPNHTIMLRGLGSDVLENDIFAELARHGLLAKDIRLMRHKETGAPRGFAFVEFTSVQDAVRWKRVTQGRLDLHGCRVTLHFSVSKDMLPDGSVAVQKNDWTCYKCGVNNFKRRDICFKCETEREESEANDTGDEISPTPTNCLILRNLSASTTSDQILSLVSSLTNAPIRSIRFPKDPVYNMPRGVCYLELHTTSEAIQLLALISSMETGFLVDSAPLIINYAKRLSMAMTASTATNAASAALAAAQWTNQTGSASTQTTAPSLGFVTVNGVSYQKFPKPDPSTFQLEDSSGFYYDTSTRLYYDPKSTYYFNSLTQQYLYWSDEYQTYLPPESASIATAPTADSKKEKTPDKVKTAKKIAKDMEKWVKTLNQKTTTGRPFHTDQIETSEKPLPSCSARESAPPPLPENRGREAEPESAVLIDPAVIRKEEECKLMDWSKLLCLLCKRQFVSKDQLAKHQQVSELHKSNLNAMLRSVLSVEQMDVLLRRDGQYVDRASERRKKWRHDEPVEPNLMKEKYLEEITAEASAQAAEKSAKKIDSSNKGTRMLKAMGWKEGQGLGKQNKGRTEVLDVQVRSDTSGLGTPSAGLLPGQTYKDAVKRAMAQRYKELSAE